MFIWYYWYVAESQQSSLARIVWDCAQDTIYNSIAVVVDCDDSVKTSVLLYKARTGFGAQHAKNLYFVTKLQMGFSHSWEVPRSCSDQTFCKGPVSNYNMTLWTGLFGSDTQLTLLIYCLVYGPLKLAFWTPKTWLFGQNGSLDPIFGGTQIRPPKTDILTNGTDFTTL